MAVDLTVAPGQVESTVRRQIAGYTGPASYAAGGDALAPADFRMGKIFAVLGAVITNGSAVRVGVWVASSQKLQFFVPNTGSEATGDLSGYSGTIEVVGQ
jgi:hypothetical protein